MNRADYKPPASIEVARAMQRLAILERVATGVNGTDGLMGKLRRGEMTVHQAAWAYDHVLTLEVGPHGNESDGGEGGRL